MSLHYLCLQDICIEQKQQFLTYQAGRENHRNHNLYILDPSIFFKLFTNKKLLFDQSQLQQFKEKIIQKMNQLQQKMINDIVQIVSLQLGKVKTSFVQNAIQTANIFRQDNDQMFVQRLKKSSQTNEPTFLNIANAFLKKGILNIKQIIADTTRSQMKQYTNKAQSALKEAMNIFSSLMSSNYVPSINFGESTNNHFQENRMEQQINTKETPQKHSNYQDKSSQIKIIGEQMKQVQLKKLKEQYLTQSSSKSTPQQHSHELSTNLINEIFQIRPSLPSQHKEKHKQKKISKIKGRPIKQHKLPDYQSAFKQFDMDSFFPKGPVKDLLKPLSQYAKSPFFKKQPFYQICIKDATDLSFLQQNINRINTNIFLTVSQKDQMQISFIFPMFLIPNQLRYIHFRDFVLQSNHQNGLKVILVNNRESLQTIMLQDCWQLSIDITYQIGLIGNLKKLKLHSSYHRKFKLCIQHIFNLDKLEYLSLSSAIFIDTQGQQTSNSSAFSDIYRLQHLKYLCLYNCYPVHTQLLGYLHPKLYTSLQHLNLGITDIAADAVPQLAKFRSLREFSIDQTQLRGKDLIQILQGMAQNQIKQLSLWQLNNNSWSQDKRGYVNGYISPFEMAQLTQLLPHLQYLNIAHCKSLKGFNLLKFCNLKYVCLSKDLYNIRDLNRFRKKFNVYIQNYDEEAILKATQINPINVDELALNYLIPPSKEEDDDSQFDPSGF